MGIAWDVTGGDKILLPVGYFTTYATAFGLALPLIYSIPVVMHKVFDPEKMLETIEKERITIPLLVPTMVVKLFEHPKFSKTDFSSLRTGNIGGAAASPDMLLRARSGKKGWGMNAPGICCNYGLTETHGVVATCTVHDPDEKAAYTVGRMVPLVDFRVVDPQTGKDVGIGEEGELLVKGDCVMQEYFKEPEQTSEAIRDGWLHTKDLVTIDKDGYMRVVGRASEMIITGGFNVYPKEIENKIAKHEKVMDVSVFGVPDKVYGEVPAAYIILKPNVAMEKDELMEFCRNEMAKYKIPKYVKFVDDFPVNPGGKVQKFKQAQELIGELNLT
jgi:fatty-acyl-CoA synthase